MLQPNEKYSGRIVNAFVPDVGDGKPCLQVTIKTDEGEIEHRMYLSPAARQYTERVLLELGLEHGHLVSPDFWETPLRWMEGMPCSIETALHEYTDKEGNPKETVRVKWLNGPNGPARREVQRATPAKARGLASLFARPDYNAPAPPAAGGNDDVPF